jgi:flagellum-specific peptidoglycan hydrolase FlgJ
MSIENEIYTALTGTAKLSDSLAKIIIAQAKHESGAFKSHVATANNNAFGMKFPSVRKSPYISGKGTAAPKSEGANMYYAKYSSFANSALDLVEWLKYNHVDVSKITTITEYANILKSKGYFGVSVASYIAGLTKELGSLPSIAAVKTSFPILAAIALAGLVAYKNLS